MKNGYNYDVMSNTLTISKAFARKASKVGTEEYAIVLKARKDYPNLKIVKEEKSGVKQLTFKTMEEFIALHRNVDELVAQFKNRRTLSKFHAMPYLFVRDWFEETFPYYKDGNYELDAEGKIMVLPRKDEENKPSEAGKTSVQTAEVLEDQDSAEAEAVAA